MRGWRLPAGLLALALAGAAPAGLAAGHGAERAGSRKPVRSAAALANRCFAIASSGRVVAHAGTSAFRAVPRRGASPAAFYLKPTGPGTYLLYDDGGQLLGVQAGVVERIGGAELAGPSAEWAIVRAGARAFRIVHTADGRTLAVTRGSGALTLRSGAGPRFAFLPAGGCRAFPEAEVGASGRSFAGLRRDGTVRGFADLHLHITANLRAGGRVIHGEPFDRFGIARALGGDALDHGADGSLDVTGNLLRIGVPFGTHSTQGWPTFTGWPVNDTNTHQQTYWKWLARAWKAGLRLVVAQTVEDDEICQVEPLRSHSCDETRTIALEVRRLRALERYVDAQSGGPGRGWFRLVYGPREARQAIARGKLAVVIGVESSNPFGCGYTDVCTRADVDRGVDRFRRLGIRSMFIAHWVDNAYAGAAIEGGTKGEFINALNKLRTGHYFDASACPAAGQGEQVRAPSHGEVNVVAPFFPAIRPLLDTPVPRYPAGPLCNSRGLTGLGAYLVRRLMAKHMLIEVDHLSERARDSVLAIARAAHYPLVSSHNGTGGTWTPAELRLLYRLGGVAAATPGTAPEMVAKILGQRAYRTPRFYFGVGFGTDTGGFSSLPGPRPDAGTHPLPYPFKSYDGRVTFRRQRTGTRTFDLNKDGVAHYGLFADLVADIGRQPGGDRALGILFRSAEAYLEMWRRAGTGS